MKFNPLRILKKDIEIENLLFLIFIIIIFIVLYIIGIKNYLLFHTLVELFSIVIAFTIGIITWNSYRFLENNYLLLAGIGYIFIGFLDILHTLGYQGMNVFKDYDFYANQLWVAARYMESLTLLAGFLLYHKKTINRYVLFFIYLIITLIIILMIFILKIFPECFIAEVGQTPFKIISEYVIIFILTISLVLLYKIDIFKNKNIMNNIKYSIISTIISEFMFSMYICNYSLANMIGHYFKIISFYFIYKAIIYSGFNNPMEILFKELKEKDIKLEKDLKAAIEKNREYDNILLYRSRQALLGELIGNVVHQWRQPLNSLYLITQNLIEILKEDSIDREIINKNLKKMTTLILYLNEVLENFRNYFKSNKNKEEFNFYNCLHKSLLIIDDIMKKNNIEIIINGGKDCNYIGYEHEFSYIFLNIITNAKDIFIERDIKERKIIFDINKDEKNIYIRIRDTGGGFKENLDKVFKEYFTTKKDGTGIGLFLCNQIIKNNNGKISVSNWDMGAEFNIVLPYN